MTDEMKNIMEQLTKPLDPSRIQLRVQNAGETKRGVWCTLLAYKDSRVDVERLNEVFGLDWELDYREDASGNKVCMLSVWDGNKWITRSDVGTESYTEKEKGSYSDALKRGAFRFGIGIELYSMPTIFIWLEDKEYKRKGDKIQPRINGWRMAYEGEFIVVYDAKGKARFKEHWDFLK